MTWQWTVSGTSSATRGCPSMSKTVSLTRYFQWPQSRTGNNSGTIFSLFKQMLFTLFFHLWGSCVIIQSQPNKSTFQLVGRGSSECVTLITSFSCCNERALKGHGPSKTELSSGGDNSYGTLIHIYLRMSQNNIVYMSEQTDRSFS